MGSSQVSVGVMGKFGVVWQIHVENTCSDVGSAAMAGLSQLHSVSKIKTRTSWSGLGTKVFVSLPISSIRIL